jgi:hypothetical protein
LSLLITLGLVAALLIADTLRMPFASMSNDRDLRDAARLPGGMPPDQFAPAHVSLVVLGNVLTLMQMKLYKHDSHAAGGSWCYGVQHKRLAHV